MIGAAGRLTVVIEKAEATVSVSVRVAVRGAGIVESLSWTVKVKLPAAVGVPERMPAEESVTPAGSEPAVMDQLNGLVPPDSLSDCE